VRLNADVTFTCEVSTQWSELIKTDTEITSRVAAVENTTGTLETNYSQIKQTSDEISLKVGDLETDITDTADGLSYINNGLKATGIDIDKNTVTVTTNNFKVQNNKGVATATLDADGNMTVQAVNTVDPLDSNGNPLGHIVIKGSILTVYGWANKQIEMGVDPSTGVGYIEFANSSGVRLWRVDEDGMHVFCPVTFYGGTKTATVITGYFELLSNIASPTTMTYDRLKELTATAGTTYTITAAEHNQLIADVQNNRVPLYRYHAPHASINDDTIVADEENSITKAEAEAADLRLVTGTTSADVEDLTAYNDDDVNKILFRFFDITPIISVNSSTGQYTYRWQVFKIQNGNRIDYTWQYKTSTTSGPVQTS